MTAGIEFWKIRLAAEYNLIFPTKGSYVYKSTEENYKIKHNYVAASLGFYFGGGSWKKRLKKSLKCYKKFQRGKL